MANILISYFSDYGEAMYDAITQVLQKNGNNIFRMNIDCQKVKIDYWGGSSKVCDDGLLQQIHFFYPDLVLNFNNCLPVNCYDVLNEKCKICLLDADAPSVAFWNKDIIRKYFKKFVFLGLQSYSKEMYEEVLNLKLTKKNYLYFPPATVVEKEKLKQDKNISFIGSNFFPLEIPQGEFFFSEVAIKLYNAFEKNYFLTLSEAKKICKGNKYLNVKWLYELVRAFYCGQDRLRYMQQLTDLGFVFYGVRWWNKIAYYDFELARCFDSTPKRSLLENQWVYNTSKVSVNFSHPLAKSSFSWRVMDIMASNSCLLMESKPDWHDLFSRYLSKDVLDVIIYKDRFDMRQKAIKLLNDESLREKCVNELNIAIEKNGRWNLRFKLLENFLGINLLDIKNKEVFVIDIKDKTTILEENIKIKKRSNSFLSYLFTKNRYKLMSYSLLIFFTQIPIIDLFFRNLRKSGKLLKKIQKYWGSL